MSVLFKDGLVFQGKKILPSGFCVLVEGNVIKRVAPHAEFVGFDGEVISLEGKTLLPGLIDCHVHLVFSGQSDLQATVSTLKQHDLVLRSLYNAQQILEGGVTSIRDCAGHDYIEVAVRDACNAGLFKGPTIKVAGKAICMTGGHIHFMARQADGPQEVIKAVREQILHGVDLIKLMATGGVVTEGVNPEDSHFDDQELIAGVKEAHRFQKTVACHAQGSDGIKNAVLAGVDSIEHGIFLNDDSMNEMVKRGTFLVPTICALKAMLDGDEIPDYMREKCARLEDRQKEAIISFYKAGGKLVMGTDSGTPGNHHGDNAQELQFMVEMGISPEDALIAATSNGADLMRLKDRGSIQEGYKADLLVVEGNPFNHIAKASDKNNHQIVMKDGGIVVDRRTSIAHKMSLAA
ncbi:MAG: amidohydrolase family protein [Alphaproteobacteria bacterium]|nr:amidohydrolase family protein [Alphaproteobacteria bacterium]